MLRERSQNGKKQSRKAMPRKSYKRGDHIVREDFRERAQALAYWERKEIKQAIEEALENHFKGWRIKSIPGERQKVYM